MKIFSQQGHMLKVHFIKNCGDIKNRVITVQENSSLSLTNDCQVIPNTCAETIGFKTALVKTQIWKNNLPILKNEIDACEALTKVNTDIKAMLKLFGLPGKCPIEKVRYFSDLNQSVSFSIFSFVR